MKKNNLLILTTRKNYVWKSMEEIIPFIEQSWRDMATDEGIQVTTLVVEDAPLSELFKTSLAASKIVVTAFNVEIAQALVSLRTRLFVDTPFIFYLHGFASVACWPMKKWGLLDIWGKQDVFISSAQRDLTLFKNSISTDNAYVIPFALIDKVTLDETNQPNSSHLSLYYVGRISEQKNLHSLLWGIALYLKANKDQKLSFDIFGSEDNLGSPNMGRPSGQYLNLLLALVKQLDLSGIVKFHGFVDRNTITEKITPGRKVFVSPSLHADENFGMAALRALSQGHLAVLSDWGGHADYLQTFPDSTYLVEVSVAETGPFLNIKSLIEKLKAVSQKSSQKVILSSLRHYEMDSIHAQIKEIFFSMQECRFDLHENIGILTERWELLKKNSNSCHVFESFTDKIFHRFSMAYAGRDKYFETQDNQSSKSLFISPWVVIDGNHVQIADPHRGEVRHSFLNQFEMDTWLINNGYAFYAD